MKIDELSTSTILDELSRRLNNENINVLKPCPFCGGVSNITVIEMGCYDLPAVECSVCNAVIYVNATEGEEEAIKRWNRRINETRKV